MAIGRQSASMFVRKTGMQATERELWREAKAGQMHLVIVLSSVVNPLIDTAASACACGWVVRPALLESG